MYCSNCGAKNNKKVCQSCGVKKSDMKKFCKWCGHQIEEGVEICPACGEKVQKKKAVLATILNGCVAVFFFIMIMISLDGIGLMTVFALLGFLFSLPLVRKLVIKKTHKIVDKRRFVLMGRYVLIVLFAIGCFTTIEAMQYKTAINNAETDPTNSFKTMINLGDYKDASSQAEKIKSILFEKIDAHIENKEYDQAKSLIEEIKDYDEAKDLNNKIVYYQAKDAEAKFDYFTAKSLYESIKDYKDVKDILKKTEYGLVGNKYRCDITVKNPKLQVTSYSMEFVRTSYGHTELYDSVVFVPKVYLLGEDADAHLYSQFRVVDGKLYTYNIDLTAPEDIKDWHGGEKLSKIVWENGKIVSFVYESVSYELSEK